jgi:hypothetical protein
VENAIADPNAAATSQNPAPCPTRGRGPGAVVAAAGTVRSVVVDMPPLSAREIHHVQHRFALASITIGDTVPPWSSAT